MSIDNITAQELKTTIDSENKNSLILHVFDDDEEFVQEHIPESFSAPVKRLDIVPDLVEEKDREIIVYGENENTSQPSSAVNKLKNLGFSNLKILEGGLAAWKKEGFPLGGKKHITD